MENEYDFSNGKRGAIDPCAGSWSEGYKQGGTDERQKIIGMIREECKDSFIKFRLRGFNHEYLIRRIEKGDK